MYLINNYYYFFLCIYKMDLKITKEIWEKCGIATVKYYNKKEDITNYDKKWMMLKEKQDI